MNSAAPLIAAYKGPAGADVLMFAKTLSEASGRPLKVVNVYPGPAPISMGRVDAEWVAYNHEEANDLLDEARAELSTAVAMLREMGMAFWLTEAEAELAQSNASTLVEPAG